MGSELVVLYIPLALLTLGILLFLIYRPTARWIGVPLLVVSLATGAWAAASADVGFAQAAFFSAGFMAGCVYTIPVAYLTRWLVRRFSGAKAS